MRIIEGGKEKKMNVEKILEFDKVKELWKELAVTEEAKQKIEDTGIVLAELEL